MSSVIGGVLIPGGKRCMSTVDGTSAAAVLSPGSMFVSVNTENKLILTTSMFPLSLLIWVF